VLHKKGRADNAQTAVTPHQKRSMRSRIATSYYKRGTCDRFVTSPAFVYLGCVTWAYQSVYTLPLSTLTESFTVA
jgi:hypothetical protein